MKKLEPCKLQSRLRSHLKNPSVHFNREVTSAAKGHCGVAGEVTAKYLQAETEKKKCEMISKSYNHAGSQGEASDAARPTYRGCRGE